VKKFRETYIVTFCREYYEILNNRKISIDFNCHNDKTNNKCICTSLQWPELQFLDMTIQKTNQDWDWNPVEVADKVEKNRICSICQVRFTSAKRVKKHKRYAHSY